MKKTVLTLSVLGSFASNAQAQSQETVYGIVDIGAYYSQYMLSQDPIVGAPADPQVSKLAQSAVKGLTNGGLSQSRIGFNGSEDLGDGLKAVFVLENRFNPNDGVATNSVGSVANLGPSKNLTSGGDGSLAGQLFSGQANVGISSNTFGTVILGRVLDFGADAIGILDPMKGSLMFSPLGYSGQYAGGGFTEDARSDNAIKYTGKFDGINYGVMYKFGGQAGAMSAQSAVSLAIGYTNGPLTLQGVYARNNDAASAAGGTLGELALTFANTAGTMLGATYRLDKIKFAGGYELMTYNNPSNPALDVTTANWFGYPVAGTPGTNSYKNERKQSMAWLGATYSFSPAFDVTGAYYLAHQNDYSGGLCTTSSVAANSCSGDNRFISLLADYRLSKRTDVYAGYMHNQVSGGYDVVGTVHDSNNFLGSGIRHIF